MGMRRSLWIAVSCLWIATACEKPFEIKSGNLTMQIDQDFDVLLTKTENNLSINLSAPSDILEVCHEGALAFQLVKTEEIELNDELGKGKSVILTGKNTLHQIQKITTLKTYEAFPDLIISQTTYTNLSDNSLCITKWQSQSYQLLPNQKDTIYWAFQGSSTNARADWIKPIKSGYYQQNFMGINSSDYGGGVPVTDVWRSDLGIIIGHLSLTPELVSLPTEIRTNEQNARIAIEKSFKYPTDLPSGESISTLESFIAIHQGDYYNGLQLYSKLMQAKGLKMPEREPAAFEPIWCAWGYERNFTLEEVIGTLPKVKELGIKWAVLDDGFQQAEGDWHTNRDKFPNGDDQMKEFVKTIHSYDLKAKLWWAPLAADPGSQLLQENPEMRLYLTDWAPQYITWWDAYYLSPTHPKTVAHTQQTVQLFLKEWDFDGLKMDGQHMNGVAPDHNPESGLTDPEDAHRKLPEFFQHIYEEARSIKPEAVVENCPCGTCMSFHNMAQMNQAVASDPLSSWQIRLKGKTYKALIPNTAYYGDHVELSTGGDDFASSFGIGAVLGTKFTWPKDNPTASGKWLLTPEKEQVWKHWFGLYNEKMLSTATYRGELYDIGFDKPETHVIQKSDTLFYAFYAPEWNGAIELRGLPTGEYHIQDYVNQKSLGTVSIPEEKPMVSFEKFLLIEVYPINP